MHTQRPIKYKQLKIVHFVVIIGVLACALNLEVFRRRSDFFHEQYLRHERKAYYADGVADAFVDFSERYRSRAETCKKENNIYRGSLWSKKMIWAVDRAAKAKENSKYHHKMMKQYKDATKCNNIFGHMIIDEKNEPEIDDNFIDDEN